MSRLRWHLGALALVLLALWPLLDLDGVFSTDEGAYGVQARAVASGSWDVGYDFLPQDPGGRFVPSHGATVAGEHVYWYVQHPLWPAALGMASRALGEGVGFRLLGVAAVLVLASACWSIATELGSPRAAPWAFWVAAASPALANAWMLWAHAPSAAASSILVLAVLRARSSWAYVPLAVLAAMAGVMLRAEGLLWAAAVAGALVVIGVFLRSWRPVLTGGAVGVGALVALAIERAWTSAIVGGAGGAASLEARAPGTGLSDRLIGARVALLDAAVLDDTVRALGLAAVVVLCVALVRCRRDGSAKLVGVAAFGTALALLARIVLAPDDPATGLLGAAPIFVLAVFWRPSARDWRLLAPLAAGLFVLVVVATEYSDGGAFQWGGRFFSPLIPVAVAQAAMVVAGLLEPASDATLLGRGAVRAVAFGVAAVLGAQAVAALAVTDRVRRDNAEAIGRVAAQGEAVVIADGQQLARLDWRGWPERCWIGVPEGAQLDEAVDVLRSANVPRAAYAGFEPAELEAMGLTVEPDPDGRRVGVIRLSDPAAAPFPGCG